MSFEPGIRVGPYEIVSRIGAGGMGEVWRARDTRLDRSVAVKTLPAELASNAQFRIRFEREARAISQLNHPNICTLFDVGETEIRNETISYLVMELLDGETLADRISRGPLPLYDVLRYGAQIADALDRAHKQGIVHRDLKPGNIMITRSGAKLLDFGLAKSAVGLGGGADSPTEHKPLTAEGTILGTFQYMAPEQIEGLEADPRTDIFALGALLYEMATGRRAFEGKTRTSLIAAIVGAEPRPVHEWQPLAPRALGHVIETCLAKEPDARWQSARDVANELEWIAKSGGEEIETAPRQRVRERAAWGLTALLFILAAALGAKLLLDSRKPAPAFAFEVNPPKGSFFNANDTPVRISPDGRRIVAGHGDRLTVVVRDLSSVDLVELPRGYDPFLSPDGSSVGYFTGTKLMRVGADGKAPQSLAETQQDSWGGSWGADGVILYVPAPDAGIWRVAAAGGTPKQLTRIDRSRGETGHWRPQFLHDGRRFIYWTVHRESAKNAVWLGTVDGKPPVELMQVSSAPAPGPDCIIYQRDDALMMQKFDFDSKKRIGEPVVLAPSVEYSQRWHTLAASMSRDGVLAYQPARAAQTSQIVKLDEKGAEVAVVSEQGGANLDRSRDGRRIAFQRPSPQERTDDIWVLDLERGVEVRVSFDKGQDIGPVWSPDDRELVFAPSTSDVARIVRKSSSGATDEKEFTALGPGAEVVDWSRDGKYFLVETPEPRDLIAINTANAKEQIPVATVKQFYEHSGRFSPDGTFVAYVSNEANDREEVYLQRFPPTGEKWRVSTGGGASPRWSEDGSRLWFLSASELWTVAITRGSEPKIGVPERRMKIPGGDYVLSKDEKSVYVSRKASLDAAPIIVRTR